MKCRSLINCMIVFSACATSMFAMADSPAAKQAKPPLAFEAEFIATDNDPYDQLRVIRLMSATGDDRYAELIVGKMTADVPDEYRLKLIKSLSMLGTPNAIGELETRASIDPNKLFREIAAGYLASHAFLKSNQQAAHSMERLLTQDDPEFVKSVVKGARHALADVKAADFVAMKADFGPMTQTLLDEKRATYPDGAVAAAEAEKVKPRAKPKAFPEGFNEDDMRILMDWRKQRVKSLTQQISALSKSRGGWFAGDTRQQRRGLMSYRTRLQSVNPVAIGTVLVTEAVSAQSSAAQLGAQAQFAGILGEVMGNLPQTVYEDEYGNQYVEDDFIGDMMSIAASFYAHMAEAEAKQMAEQARELNAIFSRLSRSAQEKIVANYKRNLRR